MGDSRFDKILLNQRRGFLGDTLAGLALMGALVAALATLPAGPAPARVQSAPTVEQPVNAADPVDDYVKKYDPQGV